MFVVMISLSDNFLCVESPVYKSLWSNLRVGGAHFSWSGCFPRSNGSLNQAIMNIGGHEFLTVSYVI